MTLCVKCHMSCVMCHVSRFTCHVSCVTRHIPPVKIIFFHNNLFFSILKQKFDKVVELVGGGSVINRVYPVYFSLRLTLPVGNYLLYIYSL